jgi:phytoene dehydrogenase-like protein
MSLFRGLFDRLALIGGVLAGGCVPGFITQYHQRVGGRLDQVKIDLAPFQEVARRFHGGDLNALVKHHLASPDRSFNAEGQALQGMMDSFARLQGMMDGLTGSVWQQMGYLLRHFDREIGAATWQDFLPSFNLDPASLMVAGAFGAICWLIFLGIWSGTSRLADVFVARLTTSSRYRG